MRFSRIFAFVMVAMFAAPIPAALADMCSDGETSCDAPYPECWFNPTRSEYYCSARGDTHCGALYKSYNCASNQSCLGDGSSSPYCSGGSGSIADPKRHAGGLFPFVKARKLTYSKVGSMSFTAPNR